MYGHDFYNPLLWLLIPVLYNSIYLGRPVFRVVKRVPGDWTDVISSKLAVEFSAEVENLVEAPSR